MDQSTLFAFEYRCMQEEMPWCRAACPLQVDVRAFMERMTEGDLNAARKILERHMPLTGLLGRVCEHPCEPPCLRKDLGGSLQVGNLERHCVSHSPRQTRPLPIPQKSKTVAVLGDGLAALTVAWDLGRKGYPVTLFHPNAKIGQALMGRLNITDPAILGEELDIIRRGPVIFEQHGLSPELLEQVAVSFDAVFVDASSAPHLAPALAELDPVTLSDASLGRRCYGGWLENDSPVTQAAQGRKAAATIERFVTGVSVTAAREKEGLTDTRLQTPLDGVQVVPQVQTAGPDMTLEQAMAEASRCQRCECMACVHECAYMQHYKSYPKSYARQIYNNASIVKGQHLANSLINGCSLCGQCQVICPEDFSMADLCLSARREMVERGYMPPSTHEFALEDMAVSNSPDCAMFMGDPAFSLNGSDQCTHLFFPGCQLAASRGEQVLAVYKHLRMGLQGGVGLALRCCGVPGRWAGREDLFAVSERDIRAGWEALGKPRVVVACASCLKTLSESQPDMQLISLWQVLAEECPTSAGQFAQTLSIHDPCAARHDTAWLCAVRHLLTRHGVNVCEPRFTGESTACCGYGGLTSSAQPAVGSAMASHRAGQLEHDAVASCIMCRDRLVAEGKPCLHVLDVVFPLSEPEMSNPSRPGPGLSARRSNRAALKRRTLREIWAQSVPEPAPENPVLYIEPDVTDRLEGRHILREDVTLVLRQSDKAVFLDRSTGRYLASWRPSRVTYWVEYTPEQDGFRVHNAYCHRMVVPGTGNVGEGSADSGFGAGDTAQAFRPAAERGGR